MYSYVLNNPLKFVDPTGLCSQAADGGYSDDDGNDSTLLFSGPCTGQVIGGTPTAPVLNGPDPNNSAIEGNTVTAQTEPFSFGALLNGASQFIETSPFPITFTLAVGVPQLLNTIGGQLSVTIIPSQRTLCVAPGLFIQPTTKSSVSGNVGLLMVGPLQNAASIASGPGVTGTLQRTGPSGYQQTASSSGTLGGPTFGSRGMNLGVGIGACRTF